MTYKFKLAVLFDKKDKSPPSPLKTLRYFKKIAKDQGILVQILSTSDFHRLREFDGLFLRSAGDRGSAPYLFACYMLQEGKPVIDDPLSIIQATDKVYMAGLLGSEGVPIPASRGITEATDLKDVAEDLGYPLVLKLPDSCFSRGVFKVETYEALKALTSQLFKRSGLLLAQEYLPTEFDWRIGVLDNKPLFACQYHMVKGHWQIIQHDLNGSFVEGDHKTIPLNETPPEVLDVALLAARGVGVGLYGVDIKASSKGVVAIEVNDNPNLEHGIEDEKDEVFLKILDWFAKRVN